MSGQRIIDGLREALAYASSVATYPSANYLMNSGVSTDASESLKCPYCGTIHYYDGFCRRIKAVEYHPNGAVKRVELLP